jgi:hypothetical protein
MPGIYPSMVRMILIQKCFPMPTWRNVPTGGSIMAMIIFTKSIVGPFFYLFLKNVSGLPRCIRYYR